MSKTRVWCKDCKEWKTFDADTPISKAVPGHTWDTKFDSLDRQRTILRHFTQEDEDDERAERELCPVCGVPHGDNPYTGCNL